MRSTGWWFALSLLSLAPGCTALVEGTLAGRNDAGMDASTNDTGPRPDVGTDVGPDSGPPSACSGLPNGVHCSMTGIDEPFVCIDNFCSLSRCGDGAVDPRTGSMHLPEECDDGNNVPDDGCEPDCTFSCHADTDCDDMLFCDGVETCDTTNHVCTNGTPVTDGMGCMIGTTAAVCHGGVCRSGVCGDGTLDPGEECDDHNLTNGDGCEMDCTFTCTMDFDCQNGNACDGNETCTVATHTCVASTMALDCNDMDPCTNDSCDMVMGCVNTSVLVDLDSDGHYAITTSCGGDDCNDADGNVYPGAMEPCGSTTDFNCDGMVGVAPTYYVDCDGDGYAATGAATMMACMPPTTAPSGCSTGHWTALAPTATSHDCLDTPTTGSNVHPGQASYFDTTPSGLSPAYDYNCDGFVTYEYLTGNPPRGVSTACTVEHFGTLSFCNGAIYFPSGHPSCGASATGASRCSWVSGVCTRVISSTAITEYCH